MRAGYVAEAGRIVVDFHSGQSRDRFEADEIRVWTVLDTDLSHFTDSLAVSDQGPSPVSGVIYLRRYELPGEAKTESEWVGHAPEPDTSTLLSLGLVALAASRRRRRR